MTYVMSCYHKTWCYKLNEVIYACVVVVVCLAASCHVASRFATLLFMTLRCVVPWSGSARSRAQASPGRAIMSTAEEREARRFPSEYSTLHNSL